MNNYNLYQKLLDKQKKNKLHYIKYRNYYINYYHLKKQKEFNKKFMINLN